MGKGGKAILTQETVSSVERAPVNKPPFTVGDIKRAIPPHCFNRSITRSSSYLICDLVILSLAVYSTNYFVYDGFWNWAMWIAYWIVAGCAATGLWILAHECGHHAFSDYQWLDDTVGFICHSFLLVPYFSWKFSHRRHHSNVGSVEKDEVYVPKLKEDLNFGGLVSTLLQYPPGRLLWIAVHLTLGWPLYLALNVSGRKYNRFANHYNMHSPIFMDRERLFIFISDISLLAVVGSLYRLYSAFGFAYLVNMYVIPLAIVNGLIVTVTYLQHTHAALPHYDSSEWDWLRGALSTMDRDFGVLNLIMHHAPDTHVVHHLFSTIPHYHANEATEAIKPVLGKYYQCDRTPMLAALWREYGDCVFVKSDSDSDNPNPNPNQASPLRGVLWYRNFEQGAQVIDVHRTCTDDHTGAIAIASNLRNEDGTKCSSNASNPQGAQEEFPVTHCGKVVESPSDVLHWASTSQCSSSRETLASRLAKVEMKNPQSLAETASAAFYCSGRHHVQLTRSQELH